MKWKSKDVRVAKLIEYLCSTTACITLPFLHLLYFLLTMSPSSIVLPVLHSFLFSISFQDFCIFTDSCLVGMCTENTDLLCECENFVNFSDKLMKFRFYIAYKGYRRVDGKLNSSIEKILLS